MDLESSKIMHLCEKYYDKETFSHAKRVYHIVNSGPWGSIERTLGSIVALWHDLLEDTSCTEEDLKKCCLDVEVLEAVKLLTKPKGEKYTLYCKKLKQESVTSRAGFIAWIVKLADMKDHLSQKNTLTDRLKEKYLAGLAELL